MKSYSNLQSALNDHNARYSLHKEMTQNLIDNKILNPMAGRNKFDAYVLRTEAEEVHIAGAEEGSKQQGWVIIAHLRPIDIDEQIIPDPCWTKGRERQYFIDLHPVGYSKVITDWTVGPRHVKPGSIVECEVELGPESNGSFRGIRFNMFAVGHDKRRAACYETYDTKGKFSNGSQFLKKFNSRFWTGADVSGGSKQTPPSRKLKYIGSQTAWHEGGEFDTTKGLIYSGQMPGAGCGSCSGYMESTMTEFKLPKEMQGGLDCSSRLAKGAEDLGCKALLWPVPWQPKMWIIADVWKSLVKLNLAFQEKWSKNLPLTWGYRPYSHQVRLKLSKKHGHNAATPGRSPHGFGYAIDWSTGGGFNSKYYKWMLSNAPTHGWCNPRWGQRGGSQPEPWHFEYIKLSELYEGKADVKY